MFDKTNVSYRTERTFNNIDAVEYIPERTQVKFQTDKGWIEVGFDCDGKLRVRAEYELVIKPLVSNSLNLECSDTMKQIEERYRRIKDGDK